MNDRPYYLLSESVMLYDVFDVVTPDFYVGSAIKYIVRCNRTHALPLEDLQKAITYLKRVTPEKRKIWIISTAEEAEARAKILEAEYLDAWQKVEILSILSGDIDASCASLERRLFRLSNTVTVEGM